MFSTSTFKSGKRPTCFATFYFQMCFAPQRRALFPHLNFQKWSDVGVLCTYNMLTSKCASRHNGVQFLISHLASWLHTRRFREPTFQPSGARNHWKKCFFSRLSYLSRTCIFFLLTFSDSLCFVLLFSSSLFSDFLFWLSSLTLPISVYFLAILSEG